MSRIGSSGIDDGHGCVIVDLVHALYECMFRIRISSINTVSIKLSGSETILREKQSITWKSGTFNDCAANNGVIRQTISDPAFDNLPICLVPSNNTPM